MSCEEAQLHKERLLALAEKRKRQTEIEIKRRKLDDMVLQLQHLKSKAMRERWLLQGTPSGGLPEGEEGRRRQLEQDEANGKKLEDMIHRVESEIGTLENEESQISAKEQALRERLRETERSIEDLQKSLMAQDGVDAAGCMSIRSDHTDPKHPSLAAEPRTGLPSAGAPSTPRPAMFAMEINVEQDRLTGEQRVLSANRVSPSDAATRGIKVYDDGRKVVYEVTSSGAVATSGAVENGWSSAQVEELLQRAANPAERGKVTVTPVPEAYISPMDLHDLSPPSCAPPSIPSSPPAQVTLEREAQLGMTPPSSATGPPITAQPQSGAELTSMPEASMEHPITMVFMGYQDVEDVSESRRLLGFDGAVKAEVVLIDEDDEKSLREKTVTDISIIDGTAADLVSGRPATSEGASTDLSSDGRDGADSASSPPPGEAAPLPPGLTPATGHRETEGVEMTTGNGYQADTSTRHPHTAMKAWRAAEDDTDPVPRERALKSVSFQESVSVITDGPATMELESQQIQHGCLGSPSGNALNGVGVKLDSLDSEVVQEIRYLDQVLDAAMDTPTNGDSSPLEYKPIIIDGTSPSVHVSASPPASHPLVAVEGWKQTTFVNQEETNLRTNGHGLGEESGRSGARFELRAFQEEKRPAKLFTPGEEQEVRVRRTRPAEEVQELERERQELIKGQAVKKNPGIAQRWWNPPLEVALEDQLDPEQLESHRKYQERKQHKQTYPYTQPQVSGPPTVVSFDPELTRKEDIMEEQIDFTSARKQFLQGGVAKRDVAPQIYSAKPFSRAVPRGDQGPADITAETGESHVTWSDEGIGGDFMCARAVMTIFPDEEEERSQSHVSVTYPPEESDSGLDELSLRSQDTTVFSLDSVSDSGASLPPTPLALTPVSPPTPQSTTPVNGQVGGGPTEEELEYHAGMLVQSAIQNALAAENGEEWTPALPALSPPSPQLRALMSSSSSPQPTSPAATDSAQLSPLSSSPAPPSSSPVSSSPGPPLYSPPSTSPAPSLPPPRSDTQAGVAVASPERSSQPPPEQRSPSQLHPPSPPRSQPVSPPQRPRGGGPRILVQSSYARALAAATPASAPAPDPAPASAPVPRPTPVYRAPSPPSPERSEFSYFSKYSEAAELRSTAATAPEAEPASGPFRLRSRKQRTLSMIEEEIRAAQQREEDLKKQRESQPVVTVRPGNPSGNSHGSARTAARPSTISTVDKMKSNSLPTRLTLTARTAPGKIEKVRPVPPVSPSPSEGALSDAGSEDSGGSRPKNYMQTLMEDYETHKTKRREKLEDNSVLEATRVTKRKSNMALKWEAGIYANEDGEGEEEEEEEEE